MLAQLKAKELVLILQDGFQILSVFPLDPNLIVLLKTELGNLRELVASEGLNNIRGLVEKLDDLLEILPKNIIPDKPVLSAENLQFIFEALRIIANYLETGNPPRGMSIADMVSVLDMLNQDKMAEFQSQASEQKPAIKPVVKIPASPLIEQIDIMKEALLQNAKATTTVEANQLAQPIDTEPTEPTSEPPVAQVENKQDLTQIPQEPPISSNLQETPAVKNENETNLIQESSEPTINGETEKLEISPTQENNEQILIEEKIECPSDRETATPISLAPNAETPEPDIVVENNQLPELTNESLNSEKEDKPVEVIESQPEVVVQEEASLAPPVMDVMNAPEKTVVSEEQTPAETVKDVPSKSESNPIQSETVLKFNPEEKVEPVLPSTPINIEEPIKAVPEPVAKAASEVAETRKPLVNDDLGTPCLIVKINNEPYAISYQTVQKVEKFVLSDLKLIKNDIVVNIDGGEIKIYDLVSILGFDSTKEEAAKETFLADICQTDGKKVGILFDEIIGFEPLKISYFSTIIGKIKGIAGIAAFTNGHNNGDEESLQPVLVLEIADLI